MTGHFTTRPCVFALIACLAMAHAKVHAADASTEQIAEVIAALGLIEAPAPVRERPGWRPARSSIPTISPGIW